MKVGLVLSGGGAKGAYQVGVVKALAELGTQVDLISGASIGGLNAAIIASSPNLHEAAKIMEEIWLKLAETSPLNANYKAYIRFLLAAGLQLGQGGILVRAMRSQSILGFPISGKNNDNGDGLLNDDPLNKLLEKYLDLDAIQNGIPLYVSVYESQHASSSIFETILAEFGIKETKPSDFLHIQSLEKSEQKNALLASAAIPLLFASKKVNGTSYYDGGMGGWQKMQGNTPISPLIKAGATHIIVTHLSDGSLWSQYDFPDATILEIRPQRSIERSGGFKDLLGFDEKKIPSWIEQGYEDTKLSVGRVMRATQARTELRFSEDVLTKELERLSISECALDEAMKRLG